MSSELKKAAPVDRSVACEECRVAAEGAEYVRILRAFRTPTALGTSTVTWSYGLVCKLVRKAEGENAGEWGYPLHVSIAHPNYRNTYALLCGVKDKVERRIARGGDGKS